MDVTPFTLTAHQHPLVRALLRENADTVAALVTGLGSPLHIVLPQVFTQNALQLQAVFDALGVSHTLLYAKKANKAHCFANACSALGMGVDVASSAELSKTLAAGVTGSMIGVSGPEKTDALLSLALLQGCLVAIDSLSELQRVVQLAGKLRRAARVLLRCRPHSQPHSRFGLTEREQQAALDYCIQQQRAVVLEGFAFHLNGYSTQERARSASALIDLCLHAQARGLATCRQVDLGGGLPVQYVAPAQWTRFLQQDEPAHYHANRSFGGFYPYGVARPGALALRDVLTHPLEAGTSLAHKARTHGIQFILEPGRALLDQAGLTLFSVQGIKARQHYSIITAQGSSLSLSEQWFNSEYLPDPLLLGHRPASAQPFLACVAASTCLESDMLTWRKIAFPCPVQRGDRLVYLNTAGYQMDANESPFHEAELPLKVAIELSQQGPGLHWQLDRSPSQFT
ncbi:amino acid decarboxylase [Pseudomonas sp. MAFF212428]|uniref:Amino acid decarboxylase n=1 Tax=Pseudomonas brassicae TaxID=2708063 RepID=A0A6B3P4R0_9PSED|nr:amino acid decarboxylase [Pseudomonas brassicae]NER61320.1 amino acid decarboxylase [Pseudomonas brassicae]NER66644.1 amino acid decarboxylase [Pseudomonas brassicae]